MNTRVLWSKGVGMDRRETERLLDVIRQARAAAEPAALATIVRVTGSAYRREGTRMFVRQDGTYVCSLSGGCLEPAVAETAARVIASGQPVVVSYDLADDSIWGLGIGCSGAVDVLIERLDDDVVTRTWLTILERSEPAVLVTSLSGISGRMVVAGGRVVAGGLSDAVVEPRAIERARDRFRAPYPRSGVESIADAELFFEIALPPPDLVIFGAGHDASPVARLAWTLGFAVTVVDVREAFLAPERFPGATLICAHVSQFADRVKPSAGAFMLVMNHHVERDQECLRFGLDSDAAYVGVLGPRSRYEKLVAGLVAHGYTPDSAKLARVHSPVGLSLGAETPDEVAMSIMGEILAIRRGFEGGFLSGSLRSLHRPEDRRLFARS
jgi:xanthine/CO dehydrogenase XdhC/CoxF family maturation factor